MRLLLFFFMTTCVCLGYAQDRALYIMDYKDIAIDEMRRTGIPASIKLAQGILESNAGASDLAVRANNHFGIKCGSDWRGKQFMKKDDDRNGRGKLVRSCFRVFGSPQESYIAHSEFLLDPKKESRYGFLFRLEPQNYQAWAKGLGRSGYATNPRYAQLLIKIIEDNALYRYDQAAYEDLAGVEETRMDEVRKPRRKSRSRTGSALQTAPRKSYLVQYQNKVKFAIARSGDTPKSLSRDLDISTDRLLKFNEHITSPHQVLDQGDRIFLQPKRNKYKGAQKYHIVKETEAVADIAQLYGVRLKTLRKRNGIPENKEPVAGARLSLNGKNKEHVPVGAGFEPVTSAIHVQVDNTSEEMLDPITPAGTKESVQQQEKTLGQHVIMIKDEATPMDPADELREIPAASPVSLYTVQPKDTLYRIAREHGVTVDQIRKLNKLENDTIHPGQQLKLSE